MWLQSCSLLCLGLPFPALFQESMQFHRSNAHLVGYSLGAHVAGFAGSSMRGNGKIGRITGESISLVGLHFRMNPAIWQLHLGGQDQAIAVGPWERKAAEGKADSLASEYSHIWRKFVKLGGKECFSTKDLLTSSLVSWLSNDSEGSSAPQYLPTVNGNNSL